ncbi:MAG: hypothetical protein ABSE46_18210 [Terracidiphilus sp.]
MSETARQSEATSQPHSLRATPLSLAFPLLFVLFPPVLFYTLLFRNVSNIPFYDDYYAFLDFLNQLAPLHGVAAKLSCFLTAQHNEYKLFLLHGLAWLQLALFGHLDFRIDSAIGDSFILLLAILLWKTFLPDHKNLAARLTLFIPVSWLLFQFQNWENLNWAASGLQHLAVLPFSIGAIYLLLRNGRVAFFTASLALILAIGSDGNGLLMIPIGAAILVIAHHYRRLAAWLVVSAVCIAAYACGYTMRPPQVGFAIPVVAHPHLLAPLYAIAFIGSAASFPFFVGSIVLGSLLIAFFLWLAGRGYIRKNPFVSWSVLFLLLTAAGVAALRSRYGVEQAVVSRYTIYSALLLIFAWFALAEEFLQHRPASLFKNDILLCAVLASIPYSLAMDFLGWIQLERRDHALIMAMRAYEHPNSPDTQTGPSPPLLNLKVASDPLTDDFNHRVRPILADSIQQGIYRPPPL